MKLTNIVKQILNEKAGDVYEYGCAMLYFDFPEINKVHDAIDPKELYEEEDDRSYGIENEPHTTLLYGLHKVKPRQGSVLVHPAAFPFIHKGHMPESSDKYIVTTWLSFA